MKTLRAYNASPRGLWFAVLLTLVAVRVLLLAAFPYAFGHPDSVKYLAPAAAWLDGKGLLPHPVSVSGTYVAFLVPVLRLFHSSFWVVVFQHLLGIATAGLVGALVKRLTGRTPLALLAFLTAGLLPKSLFYEHMLLVDVLYVFICFAWLLCALSSQERPTWPTTLLMGSLSAAALLARGQGLLLPLLSLPLLTLSLFRHRVAPGRGAALVALLLLPSVLTYFPYRAANLRHNGLNGLSVSGSFNLFWVAAGNLTDFRRADFSDFKRLVEPTVLDSNARFSGNAETALNGEVWEQQVRAVEATFAGKWGEYNRTLASVAAQGAWAHPIAFGYRLLWNSFDAFWRRTGVCRMKDVSELLLDCRQGLLVDSAKAAETRRWNFLGSHDRSLGTAAGGSAPAREALAPLMKLLSPLYDQRVFALAVVLFLLAAFTASAHIAGACWLIFAFYGLHFLLTFPIVNGLWDRYYLALEPAQVVLFFCAWHAFRLASLSGRRAGLRLVAVTAAAGAAGWILAGALPPLTLAWDAPILGMGEAGVRLMHRSVAQGVAALACVAGGFVWFRSSRGKERGA